MTADSLTISVHISGDVERPHVRIVLEGVFDGGQAPQLDNVAQSLPHGTSAVVVDVGATTIIDSAALGALIRLRRDTTGPDTTFTTAVGRPFQAELMRVAGLEEYLGVVHTTN
jgi:anti-anti-sigma regulatory factor